MRNADVPKIVHTLAQAREKHEHILDTVQLLESQMGILPENRWTQDSPEYKEAVQSKNEVSYRRAMDQLATLLVQRLVELHKSGLPGTGQSLLS